MINKCDLNVLHVTPWFPPHKSGLGNYVLNLSAQLTSQGCRISILTVKRLTEKPDFKINKATTGIQDVNYVNCFYLPGWPYPTLRSVSIPADLGARINSIIKKGSFDILHAHGIHYPICWLAIHLAHKHNIPSVLSLHATYPILNPNKDTGIEKWLYANIFSRIFSQADAVIGPTETITNFAKRYRKNLSSKFHTVHYGIDVMRFAQNLDRKKEYRQRYNISERAKVLLFAGRFEKIKGILEFCQAAKQVVQISKGEAEAVIIGSGTLKSKVLSIVGDTPGIHIFDWQPEEKIHQFYIASDILVFPSSSEAMPLTVLEGMNAGLHIVYAPVGGLPDTLRGYPSKTSLKGISPGEIYSVLRALVSEDLNRQDKITSLNYAQSFNWTNVHERIIEIYHELT